MSHPLHPIAIVDDEAFALQTTRLQLSSHGLRNVRTFTSGADAITALKQHVFGVLLLDLTMPGISGEAVLQAARELRPKLPVIVLTASQEIETAVRCLKAGAFDYIVKPAEEERLIASVQRALDFEALRQETETLRGLIAHGAESIEHPKAFSQIICRSRSLQNLIRYADSVARTAHPVLITGETGTGKELFAHAIHLASERTGKFVAVNVSGFDDNTMSDTLFGHLKGAYTGADHARRGLVDEAEKGTLFLDEIGELSHVSQVKLLRLLQNYEYYPLGSDSLHRADIRIIAATNASPAVLQSGSRIRKDLYYRLASHHLHIPPLRERTEDIDPLMSYFSEQEGCPPVADEVLEQLKSYAFPGNVRELQNLVRDFCGLDKSFLTRELIAKRIVQCDSTVEASKICDSPREDGAFPTLHEVQEYWIAEALKRTGGNQSAAAKLLGLTRQGLNKRLNRTE